METSEENRARMMGRNDVEVIVYIDIGVIVLYLRDPVDVLEAREEVEDLGEPENRNWSQHPIAKVIQHPIRTGTT